jgi:hypothetical protein
VKSPITFVVLFGVCGSFVSANPPKATERKTEELSGLIVEYPVDDQNFTRAFALEFSRLQANEPPAASSAPSLSFADMKQRRAEFLDAIGHYLHLPKPSPQMAAAYDQFLELAERMSATARTPIRHFQIWRGSELKARLEAGESIHGIKLGEGGPIFFSPQSTKDFSDWPFLVMISNRDTETGDALAQKKAREARHMIDTLAELISVPPAVQLILHETVERAIIENYLRSADRRWFCEGVANYVAFKIIEGRVGTASARRSYDLAQQVGMHADKRATTRLEKWAALEDQARQNHDDRDTRQGAANYAFATEVIFKAAAANGPNFLPSLFVEIGKTPLRKANIKTVYRAYEKTFGGDLRSYFPNRP